MRTETLLSNHNTFGGYIYLSDFDSEKSVGNIAARIERDKKFDRECKRNSELRENSKANPNYKTRRAI